MKRFARVFTAFLVAFVLAFAGAGVSKTEIEAHADDYPEIGVNDVKNGRLTKDKDEDTYKIVVPEDGYLKLELTGEYYCFVDMQDNKHTFYSQFGSAEVDRRTDPDRYTDSNEVGLCAGTYYLVVSTYISGSHSSESYTLKTSFEAAGNNQTAHTNTDAEHAVPIQLGQTVSCFGSEINSAGNEHYSLNLTAPARLRVTLTAYEDSTLYFSYHKLHAEGKRNAPQTVTDVFVADIGTYDIETGITQGKYSFKVEEDPVVTMYRAYNPNSGEHFYTSNQKEFNHIVSLGWRNEGVGWIAPQTSKTPVYRLYNKNGGEHHYTTDNHERSVLIMQGWTDEGIGWYSDDLHTVPLYRQYNPNAFANNHNYTTQTHERDVLVSIGWRDEGIGWYGVRAK